MSSDNTVVRNVFPVLGLLGIVLVVMKTMGWGTVASWSWWLVLLPFYFTFAAFCIFMILGLLFVVISTLVSK